MDIGIDLGTTYSVVAVAGKVELKEEADGQYLDEFDVTIIHGPDGDPRIPSVIWAPQDEPENFLVGNDAKAKADEGESPIMFAKRSMGTNEPLRMHDRTLNACEVSTHILRFIKERAEQVLGVKIDRAVVTHPAYFEPNQVEETRAAAKAAGFDMSSDKQLCMEPAAAAVAYLHSDERDPLRIVAYDLGGGTFDVTVLERREGVIEMKAFDGDHLLGGYNFDRELMRWLIEQSEKKAKRKAYYDDNNPEHRGRRSKLLVLCEKQKEELSQARTAQTKVSISATNLLVDGEGKPIPIMERISRDEFSKLIEEQLVETVTACERAIEKSGLQHVDEILMVGGSTHGPWVKDIIKSRMKRDPLPNPAPDLCVGAGAALLASKLPARVHGAGLRLEIKVPRTSPEPLVSVHGVLTDDEGRVLDANKRQTLRVRLSLAGSALRGPNGLNDSSGFSFEDIEIEESTTTTMAVEVCDAGGSTVISQEFSVVHDPAAAELGDLYTVLPKPLYLVAADGPRALAEEGVVLPAKCEATFVRSFGGPTLDIAILQDRTAIGSVRVTNIPDAAGEGSKVVVSVEVTADARVTGSAAVYLKNSTTIAKVCPVDVRFPPIPKPDEAELRRRSQLGVAALDQAAALEKDPGRRMALAGQGQKLKRTMERLLAEQKPDVQELERAVTQLELLVKPQEDDLQPPKSDFLEALGIARQLISMRQDDADIQAFIPTINDIEKLGLDAADKKQRKNWANANDSIRRLIPRLVPKKVMDQIAQAGPPPVDVAHMVQSVDLERKHLNEALTLWRRQNPGKLADLEPGFKTVGAKLDALFQDAKSLDGMPTEKARAKAQQIEQALSGLARNVKSLRDGVVVE